jgi:hypothetical protein
VARNRRGCIAHRGAVLLFASWLQKQGEAEFSVAANWSIRNVELMIDQAVTNFHELDARGIRSCRASDVEILQQTSFAPESIKEMAVVDRNGQTLCTDHGNVFLAREIVATAATSNSEIMLDVVRTAEGDERLLHVRRLASPGKPGLSALLRASQLLPRIAPDENPFSGYARMTLADGTLVGTSGVELPERDRRIDQIVGRTKSERYGPIVTVEMVRNRSQRALLHPQAGSQHHQDRQNVRRCGRNRASIAGYRRDACRLVPRSTNASYCRRRGKF